MVGQLVNIFSLFIWLISFPYSFGQQTVHQVLCWMPGIWNRQRNLQPSLGSQANDHFLIPQPRTFYLLQRSYMASAKEPPGEKDQCQLDKAALRLLEHCSSLRVKNIHSRASGLTFLESLVQHCPLGSHIATATVRHMFLQTRWLFLPSA